jgi:hypothetical protein
MPQLRDPLPRSVAPGTVTCLEVREVSVPAGVVLFVSSYAPLLFLFAILQSFGHVRATYLCLDTAAGSVIALALLW